MIHLLKNLQEDLEKIQNIYINPTGKVFIQTRDLLYQMDVSSGGISDGVFSYTPGTMVIRVDYKKIKLRDMLSMIKIIRL